MERKFKANGKLIIVSDTCYRASDESFGDRRYNSSRENGCAADETPAYKARLQSHPPFGTWTLLGPFDTEDDAIKAARRKAKE